MQVEYLSQATAMEEPLPGVLMRIVSELHDVAHLIERIEPQLADLHPEAGHNALERVMVLQGIDLAVQKMRGLAEFISRMTGDMPQDWAVDVTTALNLVKLSDMQKALGRRTVLPVNSPPLSKVAGDFEAF